MRNSCNVPLRIRVSIFVERQSESNQIGLMAVYKKKFIFDKITNALFMFVRIFDFLRRCNAV